ncbi:MAG: hypothetical protein AB1921_06090 [Thermodesulfobacteriota bacterium]
MKRLYSGRTAGRFDGKWMMRPGFCGFLQSYCSARILFLPKEALQESLCRRAGIKAHRAVSGVPAAAHPAD